MLAFLVVDTLVNQTRAHRVPGKASEFWEMTWERPKNGSVSRQAKIELRALFIRKSTYRQTAGGRVFRHSCLS
jgi:hypothetical protein